MILRQPSISYDLTITIIPCAASRIRRTSEHKKTWNTNVKKQSRLMNFFQPSSDTINNFLRRVLKRFDDNCNVYACSVILYDQQD